MFKRLVPVAIAALGVLSSSNASAQTIATAAAIGVSAIHESAQAKWQADYDRALRQEKTGKIKMYAGLGVLTIGLTVGVHMSSSPDSGSGGTAAAIVLDAAGGVLTFWGVREYLNAE